MRLIGKGRGVQGGGNEMNFAVTCSSQTKPICILILSICLQVMPFSDHQSLGILHVLCCLVVESMGAPQ